MISDAEAMYESQPAAPRYHEVTVGRMEEVGGAGCAPPGMYNHAQSHRRVGDNTFLANGVAEPPHSLPFKPSSFHSVEAV